MGGGLLSRPKAQELVDKIDKAARQNAENVDRFFWLRAGRPSPEDSVARRVNRFQTDQPPAGIELDLASNRGDRHPYRLANIVLQGGGVLGLAHAGFVAGLEIANVRFVGIAGASAGAIVAAGMAAVRNHDLFRETHASLVEIISTAPFASFIDGPFRTRRLIKKALLGRLGFPMFEMVSVLGALRQLLHRRGLNKGEVFEDWLRSVLATLGCRTVDDLTNALTTIGNELDQGRQKLKSPLTDGWKVGEGADLLQIMAACTSLGVKFQFPKDAVHLAGDYRRNSPAQLIRASMSIPLFFEPTVFRVDRHRWPSFVRDKLEVFADEETLRELSALDEVAFLDGGIFSNLPADAFVEVLPNVPTIVTPLVSTKSAKPYRRRARLSSLGEEIGSIGFMVRNQRDRDAVEQMKRRKQAFTLRQQQSGRSPDMPPAWPFHVQPINVGDANWLNFVLDESEMADLFERGLERALDLIEGLGKEP